METQNLRDENHFKSCALEISFLDWKLWWSSEWLKKRLIHNHYRFKEHQINPIQYFLSMWG